MRRVLYVIAIVVVSCLSVSSGGRTFAQEKSSKAKPAATAANPVNLNTATAAELQALPGLGAATAKLILEHRQKNGGFKKVEELMNIKGIGEKSFLKLKPLVTVAPEKGERQEKDL